jgi:uncharacterized membrane protein YozB (DUF420 family)
VGGMKIYDLNLILQFIIFALFLIGVYHVKGRERSLRKHRLFMGAAILLNAIPIFLIMGRSLFAYSGLLIERFYEFGPLITWVHAIAGGLAEIFSVTFLFKHPRKIRFWMRMTAALWTVALLLGIASYMYYYVL